MSGALGYFQNSRAFYFEKMGGYILKNTFRKCRQIPCPACGQPTQIKVREDTILLNFPLLCAKCNASSLVHVVEWKVTVCADPDSS